MLLHIGEEYRALDGSVNDQWSTDPLGAKTRHVYLHPYFIDKYQAIGIETRLAQTPLFSTRRDKRGGQGEWADHPALRHLALQRYDWTDHGANHGQVVRYRVAAVELPSGDAAGTTKLREITASDWSDAIAVSADCGGGTSAYFNRGLVISQFVSRLMRQNHWKVRDIKDRVKELEEPIRRFLSGDLRLALLSLLDEVIDDPGLHLYIGMYELADDELVGRLKILRGHAHIVLSNGSDKSGDGNASARSALKKAKVDVHDRLLGSKGLGHNKFVAEVRANGNKPLKVLTGSTN